MRPDALLFFLLSCTLVSGCNRGGTEHSIREEIRAAMQRQEDAWNKGDINGFMEVYWESDSLSFVTEKGITKGYAPLLERYQKSYPDRKAMGKLNFEILNLEAIDADNAYLNGTWQLRRDQDSLGGYFTLIWRRFPDGWKIVYDHTS